MAINTSVGKTSVVGSLSYNSVYSGILQIKLNSLSVAGNSSSITVSWVYKKNSDDPWGAFNLNGSSNVVLRINGVSYSVDPANFDLRSAGVGATQTIASKTLNIDHDSDGGKAIAVSAAHNTGTSWGAKAIAGQTVNLPDIPRASDISSVTAAVYAGAAVTVAIGRKSTAFTHKVVFSLGSYSQSYTGVATSQAFTIPLSWCAAMPNSTTGGGLVTVTTYNGSTQIGSPVSKGFTVRVPASVVPSISAFSAAIGTSKVPVEWGIYVQRYSTVKLSVTGAGVYGSTISSRLISGDGYSSTAESFTTGGIRGSGTITYTAKLTDSRGRSVSKTVSINVHPYESPCIEETTACNRATSAGAISESGTYIRILPKCSYSSCGNKNTIAVTASFMPSGGAWSTASALSPGTASIIGGGLISVDKSYSVKLTATDKFESRTNLYQIESSGSIIDLLNNGKGIAFGKAAESSEIVDFGWAAKFTEGIFCIPIASNADLNNITKPGWYSCRGTATAATLANCPTKIAFGLEVLTTSGVCQVLTEYLSSGLKRYFRSFYAPTWGPWYRMPTEADPRWQELILQQDNSTQNARLGFRRTTGTTLKSIYLGHGSRSDIQQFFISLDNETGSPTYYFDKDSLSAYKCKPDLGVVTNPWANTHTDKLNGMSARMQSGEVLVPVPAANTNVHFAVKFPVAFKTAPVVVACSSTASPQVLSAVCTRGVTASGFTLSFRRTDTSSTGINWIAVE